jgi:NADPH:quinone reductase-like Zn-dependent oxidoreductase
MREYRVRGRGIEQIVLTERPTPRPGKRQVLIRMKAAALNRRDLMIVSSSLPERRSGLVPVSDGVGEVVEVGSEVSRVRIGERVCGTFLQGWQGGHMVDADTETALGGERDGVLAEYVTLDERGVVHVPGHLTDEEAATLPCAALTAWHALFETGRVRAGQTVLIQGTGGVSLFALQFAKLAGARVLVISSSDEKLGRAIDLGAAAGLNYSRSPEWDLWALEQTAGSGVDHVVEVGGPQTLARSIRAARRGGDISVTGVLAGDGGAVPVKSILFKQLRLLGVFVGSRQMFEAMNRAVAAHELRPVVDRVYPFESAVDAYRYLGSAAHFGKVVVRIAA